MPVDGRIPPSNRLPYRHANRPSLLTSVRNNFIIESMSFYSALMNWDFCESPLGAPRYESFDKSVRFSSHPFFFLCTSAICSLPELLLVCSVIEKQYFCMGNKQGRQAGAAREPFTHKHTKGSSPALFILPALYSSSFAPPCFLSAGIHAGRSGVLHLWSNNNDATPWDSWGAATGTAPDGQTASAATPFHINLSWLSLYLNIILFFFFFFNTKCTTLQKIVVIAVTASTTDADEKKAKKKTLGEMCFCLGDRGLLLSL